MAPLFNLARMTVASSGTGNITLSNAVQGFLTFDLAGCSTLAAGQDVSYAINDTNNSEIGTGTYFSSSLLLTRNPADSTNGGSPIDMSNAAQVFITPQAADLYPVPVVNGGTGSTTQESSDRVLITTTSGVFTTDANLTYKTSNDSLGVSNLVVSSNASFAGSGTFVGQAIASSGSVGTPSISFTGDLNTGFYSPAADNVAVALGGIQTAVFSSQGITSSRAYLGIGSAAAPSLAISTATNYGLYLDSLSQISVTVGGNRSFSVHPSFTELAANTTAIAGGSSDRGVSISNSRGFGIFFGVGAPTLIADQGSLYLRTNGGSTQSRLYVAVTSTGSWTPFQSNT